MAQNVDLSNSKNWDLSNLKALFINCTYKKSPQTSHTEYLMNVSRSIMEKNNITTEMIRVVDHAIPPGVSADMTESGYEQDDWPGINQQILNADILVIGTPIWLGEISSVCARIIHRMYGNSSQENEKGQYIYYGRVGGCLITGNEDGQKHCARNILYSLLHMGFVIPPQADAGWVGEYGPGASYGDEGEEYPVGYDNNYTQRNATFMTWNLIHLAHMLKKNGGIPAYGNQPSEWENGKRFDHPHPEYLK